MLQQYTLHQELSKLNSWQQFAFMACLCERMYPNYVLYCKTTEFSDPQKYRNILDLIWDNLLVKQAKINFEKQLDKLEVLIPDAEYSTIYGVYPAIDACVALSEVIHAHLCGEALEFAVSVSRLSINTIAMYKMTELGRQMEEEALELLVPIQDELEVQWKIYQLLANCNRQDVEFLAELKHELREQSMSNLCINVEL